MAKKNIKPDLEGAENIYKKQKPETDKVVTNEEESVEQNDSTPADEAVRNRVGRPRNRTFTKKNAIPLSVYFPAEMKDTLESASFFGKVDQSDIVRAAVKQFLANYSNGSQLTPSGLTIVRDYIADTTVK